MYLYKLARLNVVSVMHDELRSVVVAAQSFVQARAVAATIAKDEGRAVWADPDQTNCILIGDAIRDMFPYPGVICADVLEG